MTATASQRAAADRRNVRTIVEELTIRRKDFATRHGRVLRLTVA